MARKKNPAAALTESKKLQSKGKEQKAKVPTDMEKDDPMLGKGKKMLMSKGMKEEMPMHKGKKKSK